MEATKYYGRIAYEGFAKAYADRHGVSVSIGASNGQTCVDSNGVISLPDMNNYQTEDEFKDTCAAVIHEVSHVVYGSHAEFYDQKQRGRSRLYMDCLNAVLDVADETAISVREAIGGNNRPWELLAFGNVKSYFDTNGFENFPPHSRILCNGIVRARTRNPAVKVRGKTKIGDKCVSDFPQVDVKRVYSILQRARLSEKFDARNRNSWWLTRHAAYALEQLLQPLAPPPDSTNCQLVGGEMTQNGGGNQSVASPQSAGTSQMPANGTEATEDDGKRYLGIPMPSGPNAAPGGQGAGLNRGPIGGPTDAYTAAHDTLLPVVRRVAQRMATDGDGLLRENGYSAGNGVSEPYRLITDGNPMGRWQLNEHADGMAVAILLDTSGSMQGIIDKCSGAADAFAQGMAEHATIGCWEFSGWPKQVDDFSDRYRRLGGSTYTGEAMNRANTWLREQPAGSKVMVVITDGCPSDRGVTVNETQNCPGRVIGIPLGVDPEAIRQTMPGATIVPCKDTAQLAIELDHIAHTLAGQS